MKTSLTAFALFAIGAAGIAVAQDKMAGDHAMGPAKPAMMAKMAKMAEARPFSTAAFKAAQQAGRPILVDVTAPWCPVCAKQKPAIDAALANPANKGLVVFALDFDSQKAEQRQFGVRTQSTLIAFRGQKETGRLVGTTDRGEIGKLIATTRG